MKTHPVISVLMSTYNTPAEWLLEAIDSILNQTFGDFELLIADDCSSVRFSGVREKYTDERIVWIENEHNLGLTKTLNKLLKLAKGQYIARMDADDISMPERFAVQLDFMEKNPGVIVSGAHRQEFGKSNTVGNWNIPKTREEQQAVLFFYNCGLTHPTAMFRKSMLDQYNITYNEKYIKAQDYGIWVQCARYAPMAMIPKVLLKYRKSDQQISSAGRKNQLECDDMVHIDQLKYLGIIPTKEENKMHMALCRNEKYADADKLENWVIGINNANNQKSFYDKKAFDRQLKFWWFNYCFKMINEEKDASYRAVYRHAFSIKTFIKLKVLKLKTALMQNRS